MHTAGRNLFSLNKFLMYHVSYEPLRIFWQDDTTCSTLVPCVLPTAGWIPGFSGSGRHAWHSCRGCCVVISENPQRARNSHGTPINDWLVSSIECKGIFLHDIIFLFLLQFVRSVVGQGHLSPFPFNISPVYWQHDCALRLYPLPDLVVIGDRIGPFTDSHKECQITVTVSHPVIIIRDQMSEVFGRLLQR